MFRHVILILLGLMLPAAKMAKVDPKLLPSKQSLGKRVPGRRSTRRSFVSASKTKQQGTLDPRQVRWMSMQTGMEHDENGMRFDHSTPQEQFPWN